MSDSKNWFDISKAGLAKLLERRGGGGNGKVALVHELIANCWDADGVSTVDVSFSVEEGAPKVWITVTDNAPDGFADLRHAWTLFAESNRKGDVAKRGRFNLGEKLVLALCDEATIVTTTAGVMFDHRGRTMMRTRRDRGSEFSGLARITRAELAEIKTDLKKLIPPAGIDTYIDGALLATRKEVGRIEATLPTEIADEEGMLKRSARQCTITVYEPLPGEVATLYEMGIPVVETSDKWSLNVSIKVPLNMNRDNVTPAYLREIRTIVVNHMHSQLDDTDANATFVNEALSDPDASKEAVDKAMDLKYGKNRAIFDATDPEANMNLVSRGYTLMYGSQLTKPQWDNVRKFEAAKPSGQIAPTKKALFSPGGKDCWVPKEKWTPAMQKVVEYSKELGQRLLGHQVTVDIMSDVTQGYGACYGSQGLVFNLGRLGKAFFEDCAHGATDTLNQLLIHEFGHDFPGGENHLSEAYHEGLCKLGAKLTRLAIDSPRFFKW
jgi:hypothetical protein